MVEPGDAEFVSQLDEKSLTRARKELGERNVKDTIAAVQTLRKWVVQQPWLKTPTSIEFLVKFLRVRKYSQLEARKQLENYWMVKTTAPKWHRDIDPMDPVLVEIIKTGFYLCPKTTDKEGRRICIERMSILNTDLIKKRWSVETVYKALVMLCEWIVMDENVQVNGLSAFFDYHSLTWSHVTSLWTPDNIRKLLPYYQNALPNRIKAVHIYREPGFYDAIYALFSPFLKKKLKDRIHVHGRNMTKIYEDLGMHALPQEYLPDDYDGPSVGTTEQIVDEMIKDMQRPEFRQHMLDISSDRYGIDLKLRKNAHTDSVPVASFRKLNVD